MAIPGMSEVQPFHEQIPGGVASIPPELLVGKHVVLDLDATVRFHFDSQLHPATVGFIGRLVTEFDARSLSLATLNPRAEKIAEIGDVFSHVYASHVHQTERGKRLLTKLHPDFYKWIADDLQAETGELVVIDNSYVAGLWAAERAGCNTVHVEPLRRTPVPASVRIAHRADAALRRRAIASALAQAA